MTTAPLTSPVESIRLTPLQYAVVFICFLMNMLDGMDVMIISYTATSIGAEWGVAAPQFGIVFSAGLLGMAIGGMGLSPIADRIGRRAMIVGCAGIMGVSIAATSLVQSVEMLGFMRLISGLGIGGMLASTATIMAEYAPKKTKDFWVSLVISGYPVGAVLSGLASATLIAESGWRAVFLVAGCITLLTLPFILILLAESLDFLLKAQPANALFRANRILRQLRQPTLTVLPVLIVDQQAKSSINKLLSGPQRIPTFWLWTALFMVFATLYFLTSWIPKLASNTGLSLELAIYSGTIFNVGAFVGILTQGYLSGRLGLRRTICGFLIGTAALMVGFGFVSGSFWTLVILGMIGFGVQGGFVGMYAVAARLYPTQIRATGVGWAMGLGRVGAIVGPLIGGVLIGAGFSMSLSFLCFAAPVLISGIATLLISSTDVS
ncbi:MFS transporter [Spirosoma spitsbergense]|uniref:MFS transporter n=1 Tax=Spirosoma spitsbergense TaxID=431554 RepID=UPI000369CB9E|nr:MFS transporter [Spirosoma spitsbergense]